MDASARTFFVLLAAATAACNALLGTDPPEATNEEPDASLPKVSESDSGPGPSNVEDIDENADADASAASTTCEPSPSDCLDPARDDVIEVPTERTMTQAFAEAKAGQTIQLRKGTTAGVLRLPPFVTFRGCEGAKLREDSTIAFQGTSGAVEGLEVYGDIWANQTGSYVVRGVRCLSRSTANGTSPNVCIHARSADALVGANVDLTVEQSFFEGRATGINAATRYDTLVHEVKLTVRNNIFRNVGKPINVYEDGLVGKIAAVVAFNTFIGFDSAISLYAMSTTTLTRGNLFSGGKRAVDADSPYVLEYSSASGLTGTPSRPPVSGTLLALDAELDDDAMPAAASLVVDAVTNPNASDPALDFRGCVRPRAGRSNKALADIGALER